jgi:hypothetical protein
MTTWRQTTVRTLVVLNEGFQCALLALVVLAGLGVTLALLLSGRPRPWKEPQERIEAVSFPVPNN